MSVRFAQSPAPNKHETERLLDNHPELQHHRSGRDIDCCGVTDAEVRIVRRRKCLCSNQQGRYPSIVGYLGLAQIGLLATGRADCHILRKNGGTHMRFTGLLMVLVCGAALFVPAQEDAERVVQSKIIALEKAWNQAYKLADKRALDRILDDQIVLINDDGSQQTKGAFLESVKKSNSQEQQVAPESMSVQCIRKYCDLHRSISSQGSRSGKPYVRRERFVDTWIYKGGNWVCVATNATPVLR